MSETYQALTQPLPLVEDAEGGKRPVHAFPQVLGPQARVLRGLEGLRQHLPVFLGTPRGGEPLDPEFGSSLSMLLDMEDTGRAAEVLRQVVRHELPARFGRYLDAIHTFDVTLHRETRTMVVAVALKPHESEPVSWRFELRFPPREAVRHREEARVSDPRAEALIHAARHHYPAGFPAWEDDEASVPAYQRTPEYQRWHAAWERALEWEPWRRLMETLRGVFPGLDVSEVTYPFADAHLRCCVYLREAVPQGGQHVTRVVGAVSVLAPVYLVYVTNQTVRPDGTGGPSLLTFAPTGAARACADTLARHLEQVLGCQPFPLALAEVPLPDLRVAYLLEPPTLLGALFDAREQLERLP